MVRAVCVMVLMSMVMTAMASTELCIEGSRFTLNGEPVFLLGISYYGALGTDMDTWRADLDDMERCGLNWLRVWATWTALDDDVSAVDPEGRPREPFLTRLRELVAKCDRRSMVVDVTLSRGPIFTDPSRLMTLEAHRRAVEQVVTALRDHRNWYLDLSNERNIRDRRFCSMEDLRELRATVRRLDPDRLVTASHAGDIGPEELQEYLQVVQVDFITPHRPRHAGSPAETEGKTREYLQLMDRIGRVVPVHYQEPFRRGFGWQPGVDDFLVDLRGAVAGGAAGWCLHNGDTRDAQDGHPRRSFDLRRERLFDQLDELERHVVEQMAACVAGG